MWRKHIYVMNVAGLFSSKANLTNIPAYTQEKILFLADIVITVIHPNEPVIYMKSHTLTHGSMYVTLRKRMAIFADRSVSLQPTSSSINEVCMVMGGYVIVAKDSHGLELCTRIRKIVLALVLNIHNKL